MDHHLKCSPNNSLLARRRNNTASKMLEERLQNLEQKYHRSYRQFLRERSRVQSDMRELQDISSAFDEKVTPEVELRKAQFHNLSRENHPVHFSWHREFQNIKNQQNQSSVEHVITRRTQNTPTSPRNRFQRSDSSAQLVKTRHQKSKESETQGRIVNEDANKSPTMHSSNVHLNQGLMTPIVSPVSSDCNNSQENLLKTQASVTENSAITDHSTKTVTNIAGRSPSIALSTKTEKNELENKKERTTTVFSSRNLSVPPSQVFCKFSSQPHSRFLCQHFPCVTPATYHTIGRRINDVGNMAYDNLNSRASRSTANSTKLLSVIHTNGSSGEPIVHPSLNTSKSINATVKIQQRKELPLTRARWSAKSNNQQNQFEEANFSPMPPDPILESLRNGSMKPKAISDSRARTSVNAKVRGLNQLSSEMRARNDKMKPQDWTVNYGQHLPFRILLNPVLPR